MRNTPDERVAVLETKFDSITDELKAIRVSQEATAAKLDAMNILMAEARGAAKLGRWVSHIALVVMAATVGAFSGHVTATSKVQQALESVSHNIHP